MPDLRGRWAGILLALPPGTNNQQMLGAIDSFRFEAEIKDAAGGWQMTLTRAPYDAGAGRQPITATFPVKYDANGQVTFSAQIPTTKGNLVTLDFRGNTAPKWEGPHLVGRGFTLGVVGPGKFYAISMRASRLTDAPGIAPIVPGLSSTELARWPVTLAQHSSKGWSQCRSSDNYAPALLHTEGNMAVYAGTTVQKAQEICILHDVPPERPLYTSTDPTFSEMSATDKASLEKLLHGTWNTAWKAGLAENLTIHHFVRNEHIYTDSDRMLEEAFFTTRGGKNQVAVSADVLRAAGGVPLSPSQFLAAKQISSDRTAQVAAKKAADAPMLAQAIAEEEAALAAYRGAGKATRAAVARKHGFIFHDDAYWAGVVYYASNGEEPGGDLRRIFEGRMGADPASPLASAYLTRYVKVTGDKCGKALGWPKITITINSTTTTTNGLGTPLGSVNTVQTTPFYIDPLLYDEFSDAVDPKTAKRFTMLESLQMTMKFLSGESTPLQVTAEQHLRAGKAIGWLVNKEGCNSPTTRQLAMNLKLMALGKPSLQAKATGAYGSRDDGAFYTENSNNFFGRMRVAKVTLGLKPVVAGGKTYTYQDLLRIHADKIARNKRENRAWWGPVIVRDDAGDSYIIANLSDPQSEGDEVIRAYVVKVSRSDIDTWGAILARYDVSQPVGRVRAEKELMTLKIVRLMTYEGGGIRVSAKQDYPDYFERARTPDGTKPRPQSIAEWVADPRF